MYTSSAISLSLSHPLLYRPLRRLATSNKYTDLLPVTTTPTTKSRSITPQTPTHHTLLRAKLAAVTEDLHDYTTFWAEIDDAFDELRSKLDRARRRMMQEALARQGFLERQVGEEGARETGGRGRGSGWGNEEGGYGDVEGGEEKEGVGGVREEVALG